MPKYTQERKQAVLSKMMAKNISLTLLSKEEGISEQTLYNWRNQARKEGVLMPDKSSPEKWDKHSKFSVVLQTQAMNKHELSVYCRENGLYPSQVEQWRESCINGIDGKVEDTKAINQQISVLKQANKSLEKELSRKEKALAESAALLVLAKKYRPLWEEEA